MQNDNYEGLNIIRSSTGEIIGSTQKQGAMWRAFRYSKEGLPAKTRNFSREAAALRFATTGGRR